MKTTRIYTSPLTGHQFLLHQVNGNTIYYQTIIYVGETQILGPVMSY